MPHPHDAPSLVPSAPPAHPVHATGRASAPEADAAARRVDLVWRDPVTGAALTLELEASPALLEGLRAAGFEAAPAPADACRPTPVDPRAA